jgi:hypothetical protein
MKKGLIAVLIAANLLMLAVGVLTIPPNLRSAAGKKPAAPKAVQTAPAAPSEKEDPPTTPSSEEQAPPDATESGNTAAQEDKVPPAGAAGGDISAPKEADVSLSTEKRPDLGDFIWYSEDVFYNGVPSGVNTIDNIGPLTGSWKAFIIYDPDNTHNSSGMEFLNVAIAGTADNLSLTLDWYQVFWADAGESIDETDMEDSVFNGKWENGGLWASGPGTIRLTQFYEQNGKQYAVGKIDTPDGIPAYIALVRP